MEKTARLKEGVHYQLIPSTTAVVENDMAWDVRITEGDFIESVIRFGCIQMGEDEQLHFNFDLISSPDDTLQIDNEELQKYAGEILLSVIEEAIFHETLVLTNQKSETE